MNMKELNRLIKSLEGLGDAVFTFLAMLVAGALILGMLFVLMQPLPVIH